MVIIPPHREDAQLQVVTFLLQTGIAPMQLEFFPPLRDIAQRQVVILQPHRVHTLVLLNLGKGLGQMARLAVAFPMLNKCNMYCEIQQHLQVHRFTFIWMVQPKKSV